MIEKLVLEIERDIYFPRNILNNNGTLTRNIVNGKLEIAIENIIVPALQSGVESVLLTIRGDMLLGSKDSSSIDLKEVIFANIDLNEEPELINGYITLEICEADVNRFLGNIPTLTIGNNPANSILEVQCTLTENGVHTLEIVDILGKSVLVKSWSVSPNDTKEFEF
jgi:hypothetical protein